MKESTILRKGFLVLLFTVNVFSSAIAQFNHKDRLIALYNFDGNAKDMSGNYQNGIIVGGVTPANDRNGYLGKAMKFNGEDGMIRITDHRLFDLLTTNFSFCAWIYINQFNHSVYWAQAGTDKVTPIICKAYLKNHYQYRWGCTSRGFYIDGTRGEGKEIISDSKGPEQGKWTFVATTYDGINVRSYINGVKVSELLSPGKFEHDDNNLVIGQDYAGVPFANDYFNGSMDELRFYKKTLSDADINHLYKGDYTQTIYYRGHVKSKKTGLPVSALIVLKPDVGKPLENYTVQHGDAEFIGFTAKEKFTIEVYVLGKLEYKESILVNSIKDGELKKDLLVE